MTSMSGKGFLEVRPSDQRLRMTPNQVASVKVAVHAALDLLLDQRSEDPISRSAIDVARAAVAEALGAYPVDKSCVSCDYFANLEGESWCSLYQSQIPDTHVEKGCDRRQEDGAPF